MAKACDRCGKPIGKSYITFKVGGAIKRFITNIDRVIDRDQDGHPTPEYDLMELRGKMEFCESCLDSFCEWKATGRIESD